MSTDVARLISRDRLDTPPDHRGVLVEPPAARLRELSQQPAALRDAPLLDTSLATLRQALRDQLELAGPVIVTGHQAEFFHAGVFAKTLAAEALASRAGGTALFLWVDSDLPKTAVLPVPQVTSRGVRRIEVEIPGTDRLTPYEAHGAVPREHWLQFFARVSSLHEHYGQSLLSVFARAWIESGEKLLDYCDALAAAHRASLAALGPSALRDLRISALCATPAFRAFCAQMLVDPATCATHYNAAQDAYRRRHKVRTSGRPVPQLIIRDDLVELPLWVVRVDQPRRRLFAQVRGAHIELSTDNATIGTLDRDELSRAATHQAPWPLELDGWQLRPRALTLSGFARLFLADVFIHGIGGAKYDEMMEDFVARWLGVEPQPMACVSATLRLPLPHADVTLEDIYAARQRSRDLRFNPQRHLANLPDRLVQRRAELVRQSDELRAADSKDHERRRVVFQEIRRVNEQMLQTDPWRVAEFDQRAETLARQWRLDRVALDREYFYALHPEAELRELARRLRDAAGCSG